MNNKDRSLVGEEFHGWPQLDNLITATIKAFLICVEAQASAAADTSPHPRAGRLNVELEDRQQRGEVPLESTAVG